MSTKRKRVYLTLEQRISACKMLDQGRTAQSIADEFGCGRTQIQDCRKRKAELMTDYESNVGGDRKRQRPTTAINEDFEDLLTRINEANSRRISLTGALIQELNMKDFKASNGWLDKFLKRHSLVSKTMSEERGDMNMENVNSWKERLPTLCEGYDARDIFNMDETGIFFRQGRRKTYYQKDDDCAGGKFSKNRITAALCASMTGEKLKPLIIGRSRKPRCFRRVSVDSLPVTYRNNKKAWMNGTLFEEWVKGVNKKMKRQNRNILLFMDNATSHQEVQLTNIKIVKLPANTTSILQPMDQGIIQALKLKFYKQQSCHIISRMENSTLCGTDLLNEINILDTIYWINKAWNDIDTSCIMHCFDKSGFDNVRETPVEDMSEDEADDDIPLALLAKSFDFYGCSIVEMVNTNLETEDTKLTDWDLPASEFLARSKDDNSDSDSNNEVTSCDQTPMLSLSETRECVEKLKIFASHNGNSKLHSSAMEMSSCMTEINLKNLTVQKKISEFFKWL